MNPLRVAFSTAARFAGPFGVVLLLAAAVLVPPAFAEPAPGFNAKSIDGSPQNLSDLKGKIVILEWFNPGCPFVKRLYDDKSMQALQREYTGKGFHWITVNSTSSDHRDYLNEEETKAVMKKWGLSSSGFIVDADGEIGRTYGAKTTPTIVIIGKNGELLYQGAPDNYPEVKDTSAAAKPYLKDVLIEIDAGKTPSIPETKVYGCSIKYRT